MRDGLSSNAHVSHTTTVEQYHHLVVLWVNPVKERSRYTGIHQFTNLIHSTGRFTQKKICKPRQFPIGIQ